MPRVLLATFQLMPDGEPGGGRLLAALTARGIDAAWAVWDDPAVDWAEAGLVAVRSTWDYSRRPAEFLAWAQRVEAQSRLLNGTEVFAWNADKAYLAALAEHVPTIPTEPLDEHTLVAGMAAARDRWGAAVIKPRTGAGGVGVVVVEEPIDPRLAGLVAAPWVIQPLVHSVRTDGERSVYVLGGRAVAQVDKLPADGEIRVHEMYGGSSRPAVLDSGLASVAEAAVAAAERLTGHVPAYARVDLMRWDDRWCVSELELIEPGLYLDVDPANAGRFADLVRRELTGLTFRDATEADVDALVALIESAYRGDTSRTGWTTEADLLHGQRTDPEGVRAVLASPGSRMLVAERDGVVVACCQLEHRGDSGYFGMFSVSPTLQGAGLGKIVMAEAERVAREEWGATTMEMTVIVQREDLIAFYERRGYRRTGELSPFPYGDERFGVPQRDDLAFERLVKALS